jgi:hypothetical protein
MDLSRLSEQDLRAVASNDLASVSEAGLRIIAGIPAPQPAEGVGAAFRGGLEGLLSRARTGVEAIFDPEEAARRGLERSEDIGQRFAPGASLQRVKDVYAERGLLPAAGEAISQIPSALAEQAPNIAATLASAKLGAMAGTAAFPGVGTVIGGVGGALAPSLTQLFGSNIERQAEEGEDISRGRALAAAVPGAALEVASTFIPLGRTVVGKILGPKAEAALATGSKNNAKLVEAGLLRTLGTGTVVGAGLEVPTEVIQQMLERAQAGLDLTSDDALAEYGEAAYGAALVGGPFGAAGRVGQRSIARSEAEQKALAEQAAEEAKTAEETRLAKEAEEAEKATPEYEQKISDRLQAVVAEFEELKEIKKQKDLDPDVTKEVGQKINELQKERKKLEEELQQSRRLQGKVPTLKSIQEELRAKAQTAAEEKSRAEAEKDRAEAERLGMPLFTGEEASRDLFLDKKGELQASMLPDAEAQELASAEKQELSQTFNKQNRDIEDRLAQLSQQIAQDPTSPAAAAANQEAVKLQRLKKQLVSAAEKQGVKLEVQKGVAEREFGQIDVEPSRAELSDAITKQSSLIRQIKKAADLGDLALKKK